MAPGNKIEDNRNGPVEPDVPMYVREQLKMELIKATNLHPPEHESDPDDDIGARQNARKQSGSYGSKPPHR